MSVEQMSAAADEALKNGASSFGIVNSGRGPTDRELDWMEPFFKKTAEAGVVRPCATLGELTEDQAKRLKELERENARLKRLLAEAEIDKAILREAASPNY